jgi:uncharacterized membrane protein YeaQ/YmgE (transglycosylase-associated protein family)
MSIIAWIVLGLVAGLLANLLIPGRRSQGLILTCLIGIAGALLGGWVATKLFHVHTLHGFFNLSTWITAIVGAAVLLLIFHLITSRSSGSSRSSRSRGGGRGAPGHTSFWPGLIKRAGAGIPYRVPAHRSAAQVSTRSGPPCRPG